MRFLTWALRLSRPGTIFIGNSVMRDGKVIDAESPDPNVRGIRSFAGMIAAEPRLCATVLQTVGSKGYDGFVLASSSDAPISQPGPRCHLALNSIRPGNG
jgi:predicted O-methyltransferase YrrM